MNQSLVVSERPLRLAAVMPVAMPMNLFVGTSLVRPTTARS